MVFRVDLVFHIHYNFLCDKLTSMIGLAKTVNSQCVVHRYWTEQRKTMATRWQDERKTELQKKSKIKMKRSKWGQLHLKLKHIVYDENKSNAVYQEEICMNFVIGNCMRPSFHYGFWYSSEMTKMKFYGRH